MQQIMPPVKRKCLKNSAPFTNYIRRTNNTKVDDAHDFDVVMSMYNLMEYSDNYSKTFGIFGSIAGMNQL